MKLFLAALGAVIIGYVLGYSVKIIRQSNEALVERLGRYHRTLKPGIYFILPWLDTIVYQNTTREQVLEIERQSAITKDNVALEVDAIVYWRILNLERTYYTVENIETALKNVVISILRSEIGRIKLEQAVHARSEIAQTLLQQLNEAVANWGIKITRVQ
jgi:regulator of protease activity HflC (stomatin/prohibitin superfamily)